MAGHAQLHRLHLYPQEVVQVRVRRHAHHLRAAHGGHGGDQRHLAGGHRDHDPGGARSHPGHGGLAAGAAHAVEAVLVVLAGVLAVVGPQQPAGGVVVDGVDVVGRDGQPAQGQWLLRQQGRVEPGMGGELGEAGPGRGVHSEALPHQILALPRHAVPEPQLCRADLLVALEGDVPADHVVQEDAEAPHRGALPVVAVVADPLRRRVHAGPVKIRVDSIPQLSARPEVNQLQIKCLQIHEKILVLDVSVDDSLPVAGQHRLHNLRYKNN